MQLSDFRPPIRNAAMVEFCRFLFPYYLKHLKLDVELTEPTVELLQKIRSERVVFFLNHPDRFDPMIMGAIDQALKQELYCIIAREVFDWNLGAQGWLFQRLGGYSVNRGVIDLPSIRMTKQILHVPAAKLVVCPEGKITCDDQSIHTISNSLVHIFLDVQTELARNNEGSVCIVPISTHYELVGDLEKSVSKVLASIERKLEIKTQSGTDVYARISHACDCLVNRIIAGYDFHLSPSLSIAERTSSLVEMICHRIAAFLDAKLPDGINGEFLLYRVRALVMSAYDRLNSKESYERTIQRGRRAVLRQFLSDLDRVERILICHATMVQAETPLRACRTLDFLEMELFGRMTSKGRRRAIVSAGEPFEVAAYMENYRKHKHEEANRLGGALHDVMQQALNQASGAV